MESDTPQLCDGVPLTAIHYLLPLQFRLRMKYVTPGK